MRHLARVVLLAYPRSFRRRFGDDWMRAVADLRTHGRRSAFSVAGHLLADTCLTAPRLRWESSMPIMKTGLKVFGVIVLLFGLLVGAPIIVFPVALVLGVMVLTAQHHDRPIAVEALAWGRRWYLWLVAAAVLCGVGFLMLLTEEDQYGGLSSAAWLVWILSWLAAAVLAVIGVGLGANRYVHQRRA